MKYGMKLENLDEEEIREIGEAVGDAFFDYEFSEGQKGMNYIADTREKMRYMITAYIRAAVHSGILYTTSGNGEGYIIVNSPVHGYTKDATSRFLKEFVSAIGIKGVFRFLVMAVKGGHAFKMDLRKSKTPYICLEVLAVRKEYQGKGYMRQLMNLLYEIQAEENLGIYIGTDDPVKMSKYVHCGMKLVNTRICNQVFRDYELYREPEKI